MKLLKTISGIFLAVCLSAGIALGDTPSVSGYYPFWAQYSEFTPSDVRWDFYSDIIYGYFVPGDDGSVQMADESDEENFNALMKQAKANKVKAWISLGGPGMSDAMSEMAADEAKRSSFVSSVAELFNTHSSLAGIELSWEFPSAEDKDNWAALVNELKAAVGDNKLASTIHVTDQSGYDMEVIKTLDRVSVLAMEMMNEEMETLVPHSDAQKAVKTIKNLIEQGVSADKITLTMPLYGRSYIDADGLGSTHNGFGSGNEGILTWNELVGKFDSKDYSVKFDEATKSEVAVGNGETIVFSGIPSIRFAAEQVKELGLQGIVLSDVISDFKHPLVSLAVTAGQVLRPDVDYSKTK